MSNSRRPAARLRKAIVYATTAMILSFVQIGEAAPITWTFNQAYVNDGYGDYGQVTGSLHL